MSEEEAKRGPNVAVWVIVGIIALMLGSMAVTVFVSLEYGASEGYIPPEERGTVDAAR